MTGLSGQANINFATITNVQSTGSNLYNDLTGASGQFNLNFATISNLQSTGTLLYNDLTGLSGQAGINYATITNLFNTGKLLSAISVTGSNIINYANLTGIGGLQVSQSGNIVLFSGGAGSTTNNYYTLNSGSGIFFYQTGLSSGVSQQFITYPTILNTNPIVIATLYDNIDNNIMAYQISGANPTGFWIIMSETTQTTGYGLNVFASNSTNTGMATNVIVNNYYNTGAGGSGSFGVSITGSATITGILNITGDGSLQYNVSGQTLTISVALPRLYIGSGSPEGVVSAISGSIYTDYFNIALYQKITGSSVNGWQ
jgi:hypothetical protein